MQIAIVDDRAEDREELSVCLENYMKKHQLDYTLTEFEDGENFLKAAAQVDFQLVFMDIYMENMDGIEAARRLRQKNRLCKIVFLTITEDYARMGYSLSASYYLLKPLSLHQADFEEAMELCQLKPPYEVMTLSVMADRQKLELPTEKILYIDYQNRMTRIHTAERVIPVSGGFQEVTAALQKDKRFLPCYRGVLINMDYISQVDSQTFRLINGENLPIALRNGKQLRETYRQYVFSGMGGYRMRIKEIRRRILGGCLACFLCFTGSIPAFAAETATPANADERREIPQGLESEASETLEIGTPEASEEVSLVLVTEIQKEDELLSLPDFTLPLRATPSDDDLEEMPPAVITSIEQWYPYTDAFAVQQGSGTEALENLFAFSPYYLDCYAENGTSYTAVVEWDFSGIDLNTVGLYHAIGKLSAPANTAFAEGIAFPEISIPVSVQAPGRPDINCFLAARGNLRFPWVTPPGELDEISVWLSENNGSWNQLGNGIYVGREMLSIATRLLTPGSSYRLQVDYDGGQTGILSFTYADEIVLEGYHEGDRDGGDAGGNPPDTIIQPPPEDTGDQDDGFADRPSTKPPKPPVTNGGAEEALEPDAGSDEPTIPESENRKEPVQSIMTVPPESADSKKPVFSEFFDETTDRISGTRFLMMLQTGEQRAIFSKQGITISIPKDTLPEGIQNEDQIEVIIQKDTDGGFSFSFSINGTVLNSLPDVSVMLPYPNDPAAGTLFLCDESGVEVPMTGYDDTAKAASFQISHTGTYTIVGKEDTASLAHAADTEHSWSPIFFLIPACLFLLSAGVFFLKRRRK
ncbi:DNA-binding response regulator [Clostridiaceae bacterium AF29-16BH]|nr:DNA-binding response regulator [Clostridiaceae bacterium AF29-16BH]